MTAPNQSVNLPTARQPFPLRELAMPGVLAAFATYLLYGVVTMEIPDNVVFPGPRFFPLVILIGLYAFALVLVLQALRESRAKRPHGSPPWVETQDLVELGGTESQPAGEGTKTLVPIDWISFAWAVGSFLAFALLLPYLGWVIAGGLLFCGVARAFGSRRVLFDLFVGLSVSSAAYIAFDMILGLSLPSGILGWGF